MRDNNELIVTDIKELTKKRRLIYINYEPAFALYSNEIYKYGIQDGECISNDIYNEIVERILKSRAIHRAMELLKVKDYTEGELYKKLKDSYYPQECIDCAFEYVKGYGYVNDVRYAGNYISCMADSRSRKQIEVKLYQKGISKDLINRLCEEYYQDNEETELRLAERYILKKLGNKTDIDFKERAKVSEYLYRKGFSFEIINKALDIVENDGY